MKLLAGGVQDVSAQRALRQLEGALNELRRGIPVTGSTTEEKLASLLAALTQLGVITNRTE